MTDPYQASVRLRAWLDQYAKLSGIDPEVAHKANHAELRASDVRAILAAVPRPLLRPTCCDGCDTTEMVERAGRWWCVDKDAMSPCPNRLPGIPCETCERPRSVHVCLSCTPDGIYPGRGCGDCRNSGWNQTPCLPPRRAS
jgi:hypothetical protein